MGWQQQSRAEKPAPLLIPHEPAKSLQDPKTQTSHSKPVHPPSSGVKATVVWALSWTLRYAYPPSDTVLLPRYSADCTMEAELDMDII